LEVIKRGFSTLFVAGFLELASDCPLYTSTGLESILLVTGFYGDGLDRYFAFAFCIYIKEGRLFMTTVLTYGTFDLLHWEHIHLLERAADLGDRLIVGLSTDEFNAQKHKEAYNSYEHRKYILEAVRYVDEVIPERSWE
jgi:glycerol-3-phosphate cytidylyltransferase